MIKAIKKIAAKWRRFLYENEFHLFIGRKKVSVCGRGTERGEFANGRFEANDALHVKCRNCQKFERGEPMDMPF